MSDEPRAVTVCFSGSTARLRLVAYLRGLRRPSVFAPILVVALFPTVLDQGVNLLMGNAGFSMQFFLIGLAGAALLITLGALVVVMRSVPPSVVTFDEDGVREEVGGRVRKHPWTWVVECEEDQHSITLHCSEAMRSLRLTSSAEVRHMVIDKGMADIDALRRLLREHTKLGA